MRGANLITTSSKCSVRAIKKRHNNSVDADFYAVKGHYQRSTLWAGHQLNCSHILPVWLCNFLLYDTDSRGHRGRDIGSVSGTGWQNVCDGVAVYTNTFPCRYEVQQSR